MIPPLMTLYDDLPTVRGRTRRVADYPARRWRPPEGVVDYERVSARAQIAAAKAKRERKNAKRLAQRPRRVFRIGRGQVLLQMLDPVTFEPIGETIGTIVENPGVSLSSQTDWSAFDG